MQIKYEKVKFGQRKEYNKPGGGGGGSRWQIKWQNEGSRHKAKLLGGHNP